MKADRFTIAIALLLLAGAFHVATLQAATWTNGNWSVAANWVEGAVPAAGTAVTISPPAAGMTLTVDVDSVSVGELLKTVFGLFIQETKSFFPFGIIHSMEEKVGSRSAHDVSARKGGNGVVVIVVRQKCRGRFGVCFDELGTGDFVLIKQLVFGNVFPDKRQHA